MVANDNLSSIYVPLRLAFGLVPIVAGADKFFNLLVHWDKYLPANAATMLPVSPQTFMMIVGIIEIVAGLAVLTFLTRLGAYIVMIWLAAIAVVLLVGGYYDIAVRDLMMALGAYTLGQVSALRGDRWLPFAPRTGGVSTQAVAR